MTGPGAYKEIPPKVLHSVGSALSISLRPSQSTPSLLDAPFFYFHSSPVLGVPPIRPFILGQIVDEESPPCSCESPQFDGTILDLSQSWQDGEELAPIFSGACW